MDESTKRIVLLGKTGSGKSSLANTIFGEKVFTPNSSSKAGTRECKAETRSVHGRSITLIDTPGFLNTNMSEEDFKAEIVKCMVECAPGPHAFLILLKVEKISEQEGNVIKKVEEYFGEEVYKYATVVFTRGDQLQEGQTIEDLLSENQSLMQKFAGRCHVVDNKYWNTENPEDEYRSNKFQVEQLLKSVDETIKINQGGYFTNEMLQKVWGEIQKEKERIRSSSKTLSEEEAEQRANQNGAKKHLIIAGISSCVFLGALQVVKKAVPGLRTVTGGEGGAAAVAAAAAAAAAGAAATAAAAVVVGAAAAAGRAAEAAGRAANAAGRAAAASGGAGEATKAAGRAAEVAGRLAADAGRAAAAAAGGPGVAAAAVEGAAAAAAAEKAAAAAGRAAEAAGRAAASGGAGKAAEAAGRAAEVAGRLAADAGRAAAAAGRATGAAGVARRAATTRALVVGGIVLAVSVAVLGVAGYFVVKDIKTRLEALEKAAKVGSEGADGVPDTMEISLTDGHGQS